MTQATDVFNASLVDRIDLHESLALFHFKPDEGLIPKFRPGQFCTLGLPSLDPPNPDRPRRSNRPRMVRRAYSIASASLTQTHVELLIVRIEGGKLTPRLWDMKPGDPIYLDPKIRGEFHMPDDADASKDVIMISTGTGLAPFLSMMHQYEANPRWNRLVMINGCRYSRDLAFYDALTKQDQEDDRFFYMPTVTRDPEESDYTGIRGRVYLAVDQVEQKTGVKLDPKSCEIYLCGSPEMIDQCKERFEGLGYTSSTHKERGDLHYERYW